MEAPFHLRINKKGLQISTFEIVPNLFLTFVTLWLTNLNHTTASFISQCDFIH